MTTRSREPSQSENARGDEGDDGRRHTALDEVAARAAESWAIRWGFALDSTEAQAYEDGYRCGAAAREKR